VSSSSAKGSAVSVSAKPRIFVAYPYSFSKADYRGAFRKVGRQYGVEFMYADQRITNRQILEKISAMIHEAEFSIFDVTLWNANVALELGIAIGSEQDYYIIFDPEEGDQHPPSDLGGIDRLHYTDYAELTQEVGRLMRQQFGAPSKEKSAPSPEGADVALGLERLQGQIPDIVRNDPGMAIGSIASSIGVPVEYAKSLVRPLIGESLRTEGARRGTRYFPID
jgi:hypothetical protein